MNKNLMKKGTLAGILAASSVLPMKEANASFIDVTESYGVNLTALRALNNTGTDLDELILDLSSWAPNSDFYTLNVGDFAWAETGDTNDTYHTFAPYFSLDNWNNGLSLGIRIYYDVTSADSVFYGLDMSSFETIDIAGALTGINAGNDYYPTSLALPNYSAVDEKTPSPVPLPPSAYLMLTGLAGLGFASRKKTKLTFL